MLNEGRFVANNHRWVNREPSAAIWQIEKEEVGIFDEKRGQLCRFSPINFVGSLLLQVHAQNMGYSEKDIVTNPQSNGKPFEVLPSVPIAVYDLRKSKYKDLNLYAPVLLKRGCGPVAGLVLTGEMAGLLLSRRTGMIPSDGMCANRLWNDNLVDLKNNPYIPNHIYEYNKPEYSLYSMGNEATSSRRTKNRALIESMHDQNFEQELNRMIDEFRRIPYEHEMLFKLCKQLGIEVDEQQFHYTRSAV